VARARCSPPLSGDLNFAQKVGRANRSGVVRYRKNAILLNLLHSAGSASSFISHSIVEQFYHAGTFSAYKTPRREIEIALQRAQEVLTKRMTIDDLHKNWMKNPRYRREYEALEEERLGRGSKSALSRLRR
jgi:hypothetical protein